MRKLQTSRITTRVILGTRMIYFFVAGVGSSALGWDPVKARRRCTGSKYTPEIVLENAP